MKSSGTVFSAPPTPGRLSVRCGTAREYSRSPSMRARSRSRPLAALLLLAAATSSCMHARTTPDQPLPRLPHELYDLRGQAPPGLRPGAQPTPEGPVRTTDADLDAAIAAARVVYLGEEHADPHVHAFEAELFARIVAL